MMLQIIIGALVVTGFFGIIFLYVLHPQAFEGAVEKQLTLITGALIGAFGTVVNWAFSSTIGSARKTELLAKADPIIELKDEVSSR